MTLVLGIDLETTGLDTKTADIIEVGAVLFDWERRMPMAMVSGLVAYNTPLIDEVKDVTGITDIDLHGPWTKPFFELAMEVGRLMMMADYCLAHNAIYDRTIWENNMKRDNLENPKKTWLCSREDVPWPSRYRSKALLSIAACQGWINPFSHRAVFDAMAALKAASAYPLSEIIKMNQAPVVELRAEGLPFARKEEAKQAGFHWHVEDRVWFTRVKDFQAAEVCSKLSFSVVVNEVRQRV